MDTPKAGVDKLIAYAEKNGPEAANLFVGLGVELTKIEGDGDREKRSKAIHDAFETPIKNFSGTAKKFSEKVGADRDASQRIEEYGKRWESLGSMLGNLGARDLKRGSGSAGCIMNIRNVQQAVRGHQNLNNLNNGDPIDWKKIIGPDGYMQEPKCPDGGTYTFVKSFPATGVLACTCSKVGDSQGHEPADHSEW
jgi:hypothetical protein